MGYKVADPYCNFCGEDRNIVGTARGNKAICDECSISEGFCVICKITRQYEGQPLEEIEHPLSECYAEVH